MISFKDIEDEALILRHSPFASATYKTMSYCLEHGGIGLTAQRNFNRKFVDWAVTAFNWRGHTREDMYLVNKVLNEIDFAPLGFVREMLIALRIGRNYKGQFKLTENGKELTADLPRLFGIIAPFFLFRFDHQAFSRGKQIPMNDWDLFLNIINVEAQTATTGQALFANFFEAPEEGHGLFSNHKTASFYAGVLRPLCWLGLLEEIEAENNYFADRLFVKTPLWEASLALETDHILA